MADRLIVLHETRGKARYVQELLFVPQFHKRTAGIRISLGSEEKHVWQRCFLNTESHEFVIPDVFLLSSGTMPSTASSKLRNSFLSSDANHSAKIRQRLICQLERERATKHSACGRRHPGRIGTRVPSRIASQHWTRGISSDTPSPSISVPDGSTEYPG